MYTGTHYKYLFIHQKYCIYYRFHAVLVSVILLYSLTLGICVCFCTGSWLDHSKLGQALEKQSSQCMYGRGNQFHTERSKQTVNSIQRVAHWMSLRDVDIRTLKGRESLHCSVVQINTMLPHARQNNSRMVEQWRATAVCTKTRLLAVTESIVRAQSPNYLNFYTRHWY